MRILLAAAIGLSMIRIANGQSAREYFNELYKAGGLDRMADEFVCFDESPDLQTFFIVAKSDVLRDFLKTTGDYEKLPASDKAALSKGYLIVRGYDKGVPVGEREFYYRDGTTWASDVFKMNKEAALMRLRLSIAWETLRYKRTVEILDDDSKLQSQIARYGRCENVPTTVQQKGR